MTMTHEPTETLHDREIAFGDTDSYCDPCPAWCVDGPHSVESSDEDRNHFPLAHAGVHGGRLPRHG
jgi:hypothetical protein